MTWMQRNFSRFGRVVIPGEAGQGEWSGGNRVQQIAALPKDIGSVMKAVGLSGGQMMETVGHQAASIGQGVQGIAAFAPEGVASTLGPLLLGLGGITAVSVAVVAGLNEMVKGAALYNTKIRKLSESTGQSVEEVSQSYSRLGSIMGGETAAVAIAGIGRAQTSAAASPRDIAIDLVAQQSVAMGGYNPALQGTAAFGIGKFKQGSTYQNPLFKNPEEYALDAGSRLASLKDEQRAIAIARIKAESGDEAGTLATRMATKFTKGRAEGKTDDQIKAEVTKDSSNRAYVPTANDIANLDKYNEAQARLSVAMEKAGVAVGELFLPLWSGFISALATGFEWLADASSWVSKWFDSSATSVVPGSGKGKAAGMPPPPGPGAGTAGAAPSAGGAGGAGGAGPTSPAIVAAQVTLTKAESRHTRGESTKEIEEATIALTEAYTDQGLSASEAAQQVKKIKDANAAAGATAAQAGSPLKSLDNNLKALEGAWKGVDFPKSAGEAKIWGETTSTAFTTAGATKDAMLLNWEKLIIAAKTQPNLVTTTTTNTNTTATTTVNVVKGTIFTPEKLADMMVKVSTEQGAVFKPEQIADMAVHVNTVEGEVFTPKTIADMMVKVNTKQGDVYTPRDIVDTIVMVNEKQGLIVTPEKKAAIEQIVDQVWGKRVDTSNIVTTQTINQVLGDTIPVPKTVVVPEPKPVLQPVVVPTTQTTDQQRADGANVGGFTVINGVATAVGADTFGTATAQAVVESNRTNAVRIAQIKADDAKAAGAKATDGWLDDHQEERDTIVGQSGVNAATLKFTQPSGSSGLNAEGHNWSDQTRRFLQTSDNQQDSYVARRAKRYGTADDTTAIAVAGLKKFDPIATQGSTNSLRYMGGPMGGDRWMSGISPGEQNADYPPGQPPAAPPLPRGRVPVPGDKDFVGPLAAETGRSIPMPTLSGLLEGMTQGMGPNTRSILGLPPVRSATPLPGAGAKGNRSMAFDDNGNYIRFDANGSPIPNDADGNPITGAGEPGPVNPAEVAGVAVSNSSFVPNQFDGGRLNVNGGNQSGQPTVIDRAAEKGAAAATEDAAETLSDGMDALGDGVDAYVAANEHIVATLGDGVDATVAAAGDTQDAAASAAAAEESLAVGTESIQQADEGLTGAADDLATSAQTGADNELGIVESVDELAGKVAGIHIGNGSSGTGTTTTGNNGTTTTGNNGTTTTDPPPASEDHSAPDGGSWANYNSYDNQQARANAAAAALAAAQQKARDDAEAAGSGSATQITGGHWSNGVGSEWISDNSHALGGIATRATLGVFGEAGTEALIPLERLPEMVAAIGGSRSGGRWGDPGDRSEPGGYGGRDTGTQVTINTTINLQGADFSDPQFINRLSRSVGDAIMEKVRMGGLGRVS